MPFIVLGLIALLLVGLAVRQGRFRLPGTGCPWRKEGFRAGTSSTRWLCTKCRVDAHTWDGQPPKDCKRHARPTDL